MAFSAVYLDHHWVLDAVAGIVYCTTVVTVARVLDARARVEGNRTPPPWPSPNRARRAVPPERSMSQRFADRPALRVRLGRRHVVRMRNGPQGARYDGIASGRSRSTCSSPAAAALGVAGGALAVTAIGIWAASVVARDLGKKDPQIVVVDEVAGMLVTMLPMADVSWRAILCGFLLFRLFDVTKPWPTRRFEALPGGLGHRDG